MFLKEKHQLVQKCNFTCPTVQTCDLFDCAAQNSAFWKNIWKVCVVSCSHLAGWLAHLSKSLRSPSTSCLSSADGCQNSRWSKTNDKTLTHLQHPAHHFSNPFLSSLLSKPLMRSNQTEVDKAMTWLELNWGLFGCIGAWFESTLDSSLVQVTWAMTFVLQVNLSIVTSLFLPCWGKTQRERTQIRHKLI